MHRSPSVRHDCPDSYARRVNFNVYLDDALVRRLDALAKQMGEPRNALIRRAVASWVEHPRQQWPAAVLAWKGDPSFPPFENARAELSEPAPDPFSPDRRRRGVRAPKGPRR